MITLLGLAIAPIAVLAAAAAFGAYRLAVRQAAAQLTTRLDTLAELVTIELEAERYLLGRAAARRAIAPEPGEPTVRWLLASEDVEIRLTQQDSVTSRFLVLQEGAEGAYVFDRSGVLFGRPARPREVAVDTLPKSYRAMLAPAPSDRPLGRVATELRATGPLLVLAIRLPPTGSRPLEIVIEEIPVIRLLDRVLDRPAFRDLETGFACIADAANDRWTFIYHTDPTRMGLTAGGRDTMLGEIGRSAKGDAGSGPSAAGWRMRRTANRLSAAGIHEPTGWLLGASISMAPYLGPLRSSLLVALAVLALVSVLVIAGILHVTRGLGGAVEQIASTTEAIARGDFDRRLRSPRRDEFSSIADRLNKMAQELRLTADSRAIARISAGLVHDIKGVGSQMKLLLHNLRNNFDDAEFRAECFDLMQGMIDRLESLAVRLRRGDTGEVGFEEVPLDRLVAELLDGPILATRPGIAVERELRAGATLRTDRRSLSAALTNVLTNAVEAMGERGKLRVTTGGVETSGPRACFVEVEDNGPGMSPAFVQEELFRPFATTKPDGIGLGMYDARRAVEGLGGQIRVESREGEGTTVRIEIVDRGDHTLAAADREPQGA